MHTERTSKSHTASGRRVIRSGAIAAVVLAVTGLSACLSEDEAKPPKTKSVSDPAPTSAAPTTITAPDAPQGGGLARVEAATVRIEVTGSFEYPDEAMDTVTGTGSGFLVDEVGHVVTNNHVIAGAARVEVYVGGDDEPVPAQIIATSECSDLAVIKLAGDGYQPIGFADDVEVSTGLSVLAAGYPDSDPEFAVTQGVIARDEVDGAIPWADVAGLIQHDAELRPGSSGGPLVTTSGQVVGINIGASDAGRFAIPSPIASPLIDELLTGDDVNSIGINALAISDDDTDTSGVWVVSVQPGSLAERAGLRPGDVITRMSGIRIATDGTLADYCGVLRSARLGEPIPLDVLRDGELYVTAIGDTASRTAQPPAASQPAPAATTPPPAPTTPPVETPPASTAAPTGDPFAVNNQILSEIGAPPGVVTGPSIYQSTEYGVYLDHEYENVATTEEMVPWMTTAATTAGCSDVSARATEDADYSSQAVSCRFDRGGVELSLDISTFYLHQDGTRYTRLSVSYDQ